LVLFNKLIGFTHLTKIFVQSVQLMPQQYSHSRSPVNITLKGEIIDNWEGGMDRWCVYMIR